MIIAPSIAGRELLDVRSAQRRADHHHQERLPETWGTAIPPGRRVLDALNEDIRRQYHTGENTPNIYILDDNEVYARNLASDLQDIYPGAGIVKTQSKIEDAVGELVDQAKLARDGKAKPFGILILDVFHGEDKIQGFEFLKELHAAFSKEELIDLFPSVVVNTASLMSPEVFHASSQLDKHLSNGLQTLGEMEDIASLSRDTQQPKDKEASIIREPPILIQSKTSGGELENLAELALKIDMARYRTGISGTDGGKSAVDFLETFTPRLFKKSPAEITTHMIVERARDVARGVRRSLTQLGLGQDDPHPFFQSKWWDRNSRTLLPAVERLENINFSDVLAVDSGELTNLRLHGIANQLLDLHGPDINDPKDEVSQHSSDPRFMDAYRGWERAVEPTGAINSLYRTFETNLTSDIDLVELVESEARGGVTVIKPINPIMLPPGNLAIADAITSSIALSRNRLGTEDRMSLTIQNVATSRLDEHVRKQLGEAESCCMIKVKDYIPAEAGTEAGEIDVGAKLVRLKDKLAFSIEKGDDGHTLTLFIKGVHTEAPPSEVSHIDQVAGGQAVQAATSTGPVPAIGPSEGTIRWNRTDYEIREGLGPNGNATLLGTHPLMISTQDYDEYTSLTAGGIYQHQGTWIIAAIPKTPHMGPAKVMAQYAFQREKTDDYNRLYELEDDAYPNQIRVDFRVGKAKIELAPDDPRRKEIEGIFRNTCGSDYQLEFNKDAFTQRLR